MVQLKTKRIHRNRKRERENLPRTLEKGNGSNCLMDTELLSEKMKEKILEMSSSNSCIMTQQVYLTPLIIQFKIIKRTNVMLYIVYPS